MYLEGPESQSFPGPRQPDYLAQVGPNEEAALEVAAQGAVNRTTGRGALGRVSPGDVVLLVVPPLQNRSVLDAIVTAFSNKNIRAHAVDEVDIGVSPPLSEIARTSPYDGWKEVMWRAELAEMLHPSISAQRPRNKPKWHALGEYLNGKPEFTAVYAGADSRPQIADALREHGKKFMSNWTYSTREQLLSRASNFPSDVLKLIEDLVIERIADFDQVRITDPQGTNVFFEVTAEEARIWAEGAFLTGHLFMYPLSPGRVLVDLQQVAPEDEVLAFPRAHGVIASTANHMGYYPHMIGHLEDGIVTRIEGGGLFGDLLRDIMYRTRDTRFPRHPLPGLYYLNELGLGTNPKEFRNREHLFDTTLFFPNHEETKRSGVLHWGMGIHSRHPEVAAFARDHKLPFEHMWHFHTYFNTFEGRIRATQEWIRLIDKGRLTALDDPAVRAAARAHGEPNQILREDWIPAIPGINYPGDYARDYGTDPASWIRREIEGHLPRTIGVPEPR